MKRFALHHPIVLSILVTHAVGCAGREAAWKKGGDAPAAGTTSSSSTSEAVAEGDQHWANRTDASSIRKAIAAWERAAQAGSDPDVLVKLTRAHYFLADGHLRADDDAYLEAMDKGVAWGEKAIMAVSPEFATRMRNGAKFHEAVKVVPKEGVPAMYWYASSLGRWAKKKGFAVLLGQKDNVKATMDRCLELDPNYFYGGPHRYFGAFYAVAPSFAGGDLEKSKVHFNKSLEIEPNYLGTKVLWAQELSVKQQDEETFLKLLNEVIAAPDDALADIRPEMSVEKQKARELLAQKDELF